MAGTMAQLRSWLWVCGSLFSACAQAPVVVGGHGQDKPEVLLLADNSGSMSWRPNCECASLTCEECLPDCSRGQHNRWHALVATLSGSFENFSCEARERTNANGATYDIDYPRPFYQLGDDVAQYADGVLDRYASRMNFGLATFDATRTYTGSADLVPLASFDSARSAGPTGQHSYAGGAPAALRARPDGSLVGKLYYPGAAEDYFIDSGIMSASAPEGGLIMPGASSLTSERIRESLLAVRPFGGTPTASALDDLYFAYEQAGARKAAQYVVLITDGYPDDDFMLYPNPGCDCARTGTCPPEEDPGRMSCPYPAVEAAAQHLRCGFDASACDGPVRQLIVGGLRIDDAVARERLDALAAAGGGVAIYADQEAELTPALDEAMDRILADAALSRRFD